jgi:hypothetical protein
MRQIVMLRFERFDLQLSLLFLVQGPAASASVPIQPSDILVEIDGHSIRGLPLKEAKKLLQSANPHKSMTFLRRKSPGSAFGAPGASQSPDGSRRRSWLHQSEQADPLSPRQGEFKANESTGLRLRLVCHELKAVEATVHMALPVICVTLRGEPLIQAKRSDTGTMLPNFRIVPMRSKDAFIKTYGGTLGADEWGSTADGVPCVLLDKSAPASEGESSTANLREIVFKLSGADDRDVMLTLIDVKQGHRDVLLGECFIPLATLMLGLKSCGHYHFCIPTTTEVRSLILFMHH